MTNKNHDFIIMIQIIITVWTLTRCQSVTADLNSTKELLFPGRLLPGSAARNLKQRSRSETPSHD